VQKYFIEARQLLALAIPVISPGGPNRMGFVDTVMAGGYSATDMAAVAIGTSIWLPAILFGHGLLLALTPVIAQLNGSGRRERIAPGTPGVLAGGLRLRAGHGRAVERRLHHQLHA
jgi:MATE family multidrug resistance protein